MFKKIVFYCDESGAKGYANQDEAYPGEVGVFAGILVPEEELAKASARFDAVAAQYKPATGKLHIADLPDAQKAGLRSDIYREILQSQLPCFWYAIHSAGLHANYKRMRDLQRDSDEALRAARGGEPPRVKTGSQCCRRSNTDPPRRSKTDPPGMKMAALSADVDPGASSGDQGSGPAGHEHSGDGAAIELFAQHGEAVPA